MYQIQIFWDAHSISAILPSEEMAAAWLSEMITKWFLKYGLTDASAVQIRGRQLPA